MVIQGVLLFLFINLHFINAAPNYIFDIDHAVGTPESGLCMEYITFNFHKFNKTSKGADIEFNLLQEIVKENEMTIKFDFFVWIFGTFRKAPVNFSAKVCDVLEKKIFDAPHILQNSSISECPLKKGQHYIYNAMPTTNGWPNYLPIGKYKLLTDFVVKNDRCILIEWILDILPKT